MGKQPSSTTTKQIPAWLEQALKGVLTQSTQGLQRFGAQGQNILFGAGKDEGAAAQGLRPTPTRGGRIDPRTLQAMRAQMNAGNRNA